MSTKPELPASAAAEAQRYLADGRFQEAEATCRRALAGHPGNPGLLAALGRAAHGQGDFAEAAACLGEAAAGAKDDADLFNDLGRALNNLRRWEDAETAFASALTISPGRADIHNNLGHVYRGAGQPEQAAQRFAEAIRLQPDFATAHNNLGTVYMLMRRPLEAARAFGQACELDPANARVFANLALALQTAGRLQSAVPVFEQALELAPDDAESWLALGLVHNELRDTERAEQALKQALTLRPDQPRMYAELAALYEDLNRLDAAAETLNNGLQKAPDDPRLKLEAAKLARRGGDPGNAVALLEQFDLHALDDRLAQMLAYELGLNQDRLGAADAAFESFSQANRYAQKNERLQYVDASRFLARVDRTLAFFEQSNPADWATAPPDPDIGSPAFLLGFPRSGTTLTDLVLDNHPGIVTLEEKPTIEKLVIALMQHEAGYPDALAALDQEAIVSLRRAYFTEAATHVRSEAGQLIVDKMPIRTINTGLIWRLFPDSKIIFSARHPCDVCISCFMQQFNANDAFANFFTLADTVRVYDKVMRLWQLYERTLPLAVHRVRYEDLVTDLEGESRRLMAFLGKPWHPGVLDYRKRARERGRIATNSYHQVTEPLYTRAVGRWRRYAKQLGPHLEALRPHMRYFGYPED